MNTERDSQRIAYVSAVGATGGGERVLMELARGVHTNGGTAEVFCLRDGAWAQGGWGTDVRIHAYQSGYRIRYPWTVLGAAKWLRERLLEFQPTVIHANHASWWIAALAARSCDASTVWHLHDFPDQRDLPTKVGVKFPPTATLFTTKHVASGFPELKQSQHAVIAPVTIDVGSFRNAQRQADILEEYGIESGSYFLTVSRWQPHKGLHHLITAATQLAEQGLFDASLKHVIVGKATNDAERRYLSSVKDRIRQSGFEDRFVLIPECSDEQLRALYAAGTALIHPARSEGFGLVLLEAMSFGLPVVACDAAGPTEILNDPAVGLLVSKDSPSDLSRAMKRLLTDADARANIGAAGTRRASELSRDQMIGQTLAFYESLQSA